MAEFPPVSQNRGLAGFTPGTVIGGYRLEEEIGAGGMATVFRARDERLGRSVALKVLVPGLARDTAFRERFIRESQAASGVDHPNIIPVYGAGEDSGVLYLAMRYVPGGDLHAVVEREGPLLPDRVVSLLSPVASALDAAHRTGILHRDVKPANVLVDVSPGRPDHPYLSDFGLARREAGAGLTLTRAGEFVGTAGFAAPEQIDGRPALAASDQYALGCVAFTLLTARLPFHSSSAEAVLWAQMSRPAPKVTPARPDLPSAADEVIARVLAKDPGDRFPACSDFVEALARALAGAPGASIPPAPQRPGPGHPSFPSGTPAPAATAPPAAMPYPGAPPTTADPVPRRTRRARWPLAVAAVIVAAGAATGAVLLSQPGHPGTGASGAAPALNVSAKLAATVRDPGQSIVAVAASRGTLTILDQSGDAHTYSVPSGKATGVSALRGYGPDGALFSLDGEAVAAPSSGCSAGATECAYHLFWFDVPDQPPEWDGSLTAGPGSNAATGDSTLAVSSPGGNGVKVLNLRTLGAPLNLTAPGQWRTGAIALSPDGGTVAAVTTGPAEARRVQVWSTASSAAPASISIASGKMGVPWQVPGDGAGVPIAVAGQALALSDGLTTNVYRLGSSSPVTSVPAGLLAVSPDGQAIVTANPGNGSAVDIRTAATGRTAATLTPRGEQNPPSAVSFSPDGRSLVVGYEDGAVYVWTL